MSGSLQRTSASTSRSVWGCGVVHKVARVATARGASLEVDDEVRRVHRVMSAASHARPIDVWYVRTDDVQAEATLRACSELLLPDERVKQAAFVFEKHRHQYLVTRALGRAALASRLGVMPAGLRFVRNSHGRPELTPSSPCRFNLTNTVHLVACAIADGLEIGVDAEPLSRGSHVLDVAETVFTDGERSMLAALSTDARLRRAVELWTLKEAYIKARGLGMSLPVERVEMSFEDRPQRAEPPEIAIHRADLGAMLGALRHA